MQAKHEQESGIVLPEDVAKKVMHEYRVVIRSLLDTNSTDVVQNDSLRHAAVILEEMVKHAKTSFYAVAQTLNKTAWNNAVVQALAEAKRRDVDIELLVTNPDSASLAHLNGWDESIRTCIKTISDELRESSLELYNFAVMDRRSFRFERNKITGAALFCANNPEFSTAALNCFCVLKRNASSIASIS